MNFVKISCSLKLKHTTESYPVETNQVSGQCVQTQTSAVKPSYNQYSAGQYKQGQYNQYASASNNHEQTSPNPDLHRQAFLQPILCRTIQARTIQPICFCLQQPRADLP
uniref:Uncharacterized protein n=1 Tax=Cacopsylla melanoneura TaxID=428564 RepID=A0A8D8T171_9HEMI